MKNNLVEVIFKGKQSVFDINFLKKISSEARQIYFNNPEIASIKNFDELIDVVKSNLYVDLVINTDLLEVRGKKISKVFINFGRNDDDIEVLFFFDLNSVGEQEITKNIEQVKNWMLEVKKQFNLEYFVCKADNGESYFDSNG